MKLSGRTLERGQLGPRGPSRHRALADKVVRAPLVLLAVFLAIIAIAQQRSAQPRTAQPRTTQPRTARETEAKRMATPDWTIDPRFQHDVFSFARVRYTVNGKYGFGHTPDRWGIDFPDSDLNLSYRLQQLTSVKVNPQGHVIELTDKDLFDYPFIYIVEPGRLTFKPEEAQILHRYLLNGGFLMCDDFWGDREWIPFQQELKLVFPDRPWVELPLTHPIFHSVFDLKEKPQVPGLPHVIAPGWDGSTYEPKNGPSAKEVHYRAILDDKERIMVMLCYNTDLGDGWEQEGYNELYFRDFSEKKAFPMGINIIVYAMTH